MVYHVTEFLLLGSEMTVSVDMEGVAGTKL